MRWLLVCLCIAACWAAGPVVLRVRTPEALERIEAAGFGAVRRSSHPGVLLVNRAAWGGIRNRAGVQQGDHFELARPEHEVRTVPCLNVASEYSTNVQLWAAVGTQTNIGASIMVTLLPGPTRRADKPLLVLMANIHGDEIVGRELLRLLTAELRGSRADVLADVDVYMVPTMNPSGFDLCQRRNAENKDLNRCFPDRCGTTLHPQPNALGIVNWTAGCPDSTVPEIVAVKAWLAQIQPTAVVMLHGGAEIVSMPMDNSCTHRYGAYNATGLDYPLHREWGLSYASLNPRIRDLPVFVGGVTTGSGWYQLRGGLQDWALLAVGGTSASLTVEVSNEKSPEFSQIEAVYWPAAHEGLLALIAKVAQGVRGRIQARGRGVPPNPVLFVEQLGGDPPTGPLAALPVGGGKPVTADPATGWYFRMLPQGTAHLIASAQGYVGQRITVVISDGVMHTLNVVLSPIPPQLRAHQGNGIPYVE